VKPSMQSIGNNFRSLSQGQNLQMLDQGVSKLHDVLMQKQVLG
jgi:hypothetical protein